MFKKLFPAVLLLTASSQSAAAAVAAAEREEGWGKARKLAEKGEESGVLAGAKTEKPPTDTEPDCGPASLEVTAKLVGADGLAGLIFSIFDTNEDGVLDENEVIFAGFVYPVIVKTFTGATKEDIMAYYLEDWQGSCSYDIFDLYGIEWLGDRIIPVV
jgi:hypothetical protein